MLLPTSLSNNKILPYPKFLIPGIYFCLYPLVNGINGIAIGSKFTIVNSKSALLEDIVLQSKNLFQQASRIIFDRFPECRKIINIIVYRDINPICMLVLEPLETNDKVTLLDTPGREMMKYLTE